MDPTFLMVMFFKAVLWLLLLAFAFVVMKQFADERAREKMKRQLLQQHRDIIEANRKKKGGMRSRNEIGNS